MLRWLRAVGYWWRDTHEAEGIYVQQLRAFAAIETPKPVKKPRRKKTRTVKGPARLLSIRRQA